MGRTIYSSDLFITKGHIYTDTEAWLDLLLNSEGDIIEISVSELMARWRWTNYKVRTFIDALCNKGLADCDKKSGQRTILSIKRKCVKNHSENHSVFHSVKEHKDNKIQENVTHFFAGFFADLTATSIPLIPYEELLTASKQGVDFNGEPLGTDEKAFAGFCLWVRDNLPFVSNPKNLRQIRYQEFLSLRFTYKYESREIVECLMSLENDKEHRKKYSILYNTLINWLKLRHGDRRENISTR